MRACAAGGAVVRGLDELYRDLEVDRLVPALMGRALYRVSGPAAKSVGIVETVRSLERTAELGGSRNVAFWTLEDALADPRYAATRLRHLAGVTAMRHVLGEPIEAWSNCGEQLGRRNVPDGVWSTPDGKVAIEYDASGYSPDTVIAKAWVFEGAYARQLWGAATPARVARLRVLLEPYESACVVLAPWWDWRGAPPGGVGPMLRATPW